jgi:hypothetical protein
MANKSMASLQNRGGKKEVAQVSSRNDNKSNVSSKFHNRPKSGKGTELSMDKHDGRGLCK